MSCPVSPLRGRPSPGLPGRWHQGPQGGQTHARGQVSASGVGVQLQARVHHGALAAGHLAARASSRRARGCRACDLSHSRGPGVLQPGRTHTSGQARRALAVNRTRMGQTRVAHRRCLLRQRQGHRSPAEQAASPDHTSQEQRRCPPGCGQASRPWQGASENLRPEGSAEGPGPSKITNSPAHPAPSMASATSWCAIAVWT